ncbi:ribosome recycling factor domain-containing protein [Pochonia chlamydosporia 170]|uniref:Ribosome recycling factor domain-containing protein n=1 Tax=Pochonia chlamydosporia 170 TaxID=1380566 RepID=A0A179FMR8_METCM|nr:ribosome recycling factor domain-containing protein [Pochonia chlamydosporia 170]OAQ66945.1 ribosome recycling factor domain-containing protein [Pochonia chlamydosporia 170]
MSLRNPSQLLRRAIRLATPIELRQTQPQSRRFHASPPTLKKRRIAPAANSPSRPEAPSATATAPDPENPLDFTALLASLTPHDTHFKAQLQTILHGGRFNPSSLGALSIPIKSPAGETETFPLRELAQVVPRSGRTISLLVNDREYVKPIMSAVQASREFNQQPQRSEDNDLELLLRVELERKEELVRRIKDTTQAWKDKVRQARSKHDKVLKAWQKDGTVLKDVVRRAERELQKVQDGKMKEVEGEESAAIKGLDRN